MERRGDEVHVETTEASAGSKEGVVRWVLIVGVGLAIIFLSIIWMTGAAFQGDVEEEANVSGIIESREDSQEVDTIVSDNEQFEFGAEESAAPEADTPVETERNSETE